MKPKLALLLAALFLIAIAAGSAPTQKHRHVLADRDRIYVVRVAGDGTVDAPTVQLSYSKKQRVVWVSDGSVDQVIEFIKRDGPFRDHVKTCDLPAKGYCDPGPIAKSSSVGNTYEYQAARKTAEKTGDAGDPVIIITN